MGTLWADFSFQPVLHDWCNKGRGMCYPVCGMVHIKEPLLLIGKSSLSGPLPYNHKLNVLSVSLNKTFPFLWAEGMNFPIFYIDKNHRYHSFV